MSKSFSDYGIAIPSSGSGNEVLTKCPQCSSSRKKKNVKCLSVNLAKECWICHHCDWRGGLSQGVLNKPNPPKIIRRPDPINTAVPQSVLDWFAARGISPSVITRNKIGYGQVWMPQEEDFVTAIQFPYYRDGQLINVKSRDSKKNFTQTKSAEKILYGLDDIDPALVIITEGEIDKLSVEMAGFTSCVSVPDGAPASNTKDYSSKFSYLENCKSQLEAVHEFVLAVDNDLPGQTLEEELARRLGPEKCRRVIWPDGAKDANDVLRLFGAEALKICICDAQPYPIAGIHTVSSVKDKIFHLYRNGMKGGEHPGWGKVAELYTVKPGEMTIVTGIPSHGKSEFIDAMMVNMANSLGWSFGIFSPENAPLEQHMVKLAEKKSKKPFRHGFHERMNEADLEEATKWLNRHFFFIFPPEDTLNLNSVLDLARTLVFREGIRGLVIDPWNEIDHSRPSNLTETEYISQSLTKVRQFARKHQVHIWLIAHPTKLQKDKTTGEYPVPTPYDISGSAHWRNKADNAITVWRNVSPGVSTVEVHVQKVRFKDVGKPGMVELSYDYPTGTYHEPYFGTLKAVKEKA